MTRHSVQFQQPRDAAKVKLLLRELDLARAFLDLAEAAASDPNRERRCLIASNACDSVVKAMPEVCVDFQEKSAIRETLSGLHIRLVALRVINNNGLVEIP